MCSFSWVSLWFDCNNVTVVDDDEDSDDDSEDESDWDEDEDDEESETGGYDLDVCPPGCDQVQRPASSLKFCY